MEIRGSEKARSGYRVIKWIGLFHLGGLSIYAMILEMLAHARVSGEALMDMDVLRPALIIAAVVMFFFAGSLRRRILMPNDRSSAVDLALVPGERLQRMVKATMLSLALCDVVALFGLVIFLFGGERTDFYLFLVLSAIFLAIRFPRPQEWQQWYSVAGRFR